MRDNNGHHIDQVQRDAMKRAEVYLAGKGIHRAEKHEGVAFMLIFLIFFIGVLL